MYLDQRIPNFFFLRIPPSRKKKTRVHPNELWKYFLWRFQTVNLKLMKISRTPKDLYRTLGVCAPQVGNRWYKRLTLINNDNFSKVTSFYFYYIVIWTVIKIVTFKQQHNGHILGPRRYWLLTFFTQNEVNQKEIKLKKIFRKKSQERKIAEDFGPSRFGRIRKYLWNMTEYPETSKAAQVGANFELFIIPSNLRTHILTIELNPIIYVSVAWVIRALSVLVQDLITKIIT